MTELGALGVEVAKNIILAGCKELVIFDNPNTNQNELKIHKTIASGQFFLSEDDNHSVKKSSKCFHCLKKLQELNHYVKVTVVTDAKYKSVVDYLNE